VPSPHLESLTKNGSFVTITSLSTGLACPFLWQRQRHSTKDYPAGLDAWIIYVRVKKLELSVKKIRRSSRDETVPLWQTIIEGYIADPEGITAGLFLPVRPSQRLAILIEIRCPQGGTQAGRMEQADPERHPMRSQLLRSGSKSIRFQVLKDVFPSECQPWVGCPEQVGTVQILVSVLPSCEILTSIGK
jgi:hypothetical protein